MKDIDQVIKETKTKMNEKYNYKNVHQVPRIEKVIIHRGLSEALTNSAVLEKTYELFYAALKKEHVNGEESKWFLFELA